MIAGSIQCHASNYTKGRHQKIQYIVLHYTANDGDTARGNCKYFSGPNRLASAHYFVDEKEIWQSVADGDTAWHCGANRYKHPKCRNSNAIGIEMCSRKDAAGNYYIKPETVANAVNLTKMLMAKYGVPASHVLRHYDVTGKSCLPLDSTELLTPSGWIKLGDVAIGDSVVTYSANEKKLRFSDVLDVVEPYEAEVLRAKKVEATANHNMLIKPNAINSHKWRTTKFERFFHGSKQWQILRCGEMFNNGISLSDDEIRLLVWIQGDGSYDSGCVRFHFKKERKIDRLSSLLERMGIEFSTYNQSDGTTKIDIRDRGRTVAWAETWLQSKEFSFKLLNMSNAQANTFIQELVHVDGSTENDSYFSTKKQNVDFVQALASINGVRCSEYTACNGLYVLSFHELQYSVITYKEDKTKKQSHTSSRITEVSCVTVEDGFILVRQNGMAYITGNCPRPWVNDESQWRAFLAALEGDHDMTEKEVKEIILKTLTETDTAVAEVYGKTAAWAKEAWSAAKADGIFDGSRPGAPLTRQEAAVVLYRLGLLGVKK